ncbi:MAG: diguanylate cyclase [Gaiellales bacterium]
MSGSSERDYPPRLRWLIASVYALAGPLVAGAVVALAGAEPSLRDLFGASLFGALAFAADLKPVPLDESRSRSVSLAFVFVLASTILFGWAFGVVIGALSVTASQLVERRPVRRLLFNGGAYALAAGASSLPSLVAGSEGDALTTTLCAFTGGALFVMVNVGLVCLAVGFHSRQPFGRLFLDNMRHAGAAFLTMASLAALAVVLWDAHAALLALLTGPLAALTLYQRSALDWRIANRAAHTDSLTGLGNHRAYELDLDETASRYGETGGGFSLCYIDVDNFKEINDTFGHPAGDSALGGLARMLTGEPDVRAFRFGGDEFALIIERSPGESRAYVEGLCERVAETVFEANVPVTISAGVAAFPLHARELDELQRVVDASLYAAKAGGRNGVRAYDPAARTLQTVEMQKRMAVRHTRLKVAESLIRLVDARDTYTGRHSHSVSTTSAAIAIQLGLDDDVVDQVRLAGLLHDLGKILLSDDVLQKPSALSDEEFQLVRAHPELGASLLLGLEIDPVDTWVRHHHEHWDGSGYPFGLAGEQIPLGSRIILVADAYDAITSDRSYRPAATTAEAVAEITRSAGRQFDPNVVAAFLAHMEETKTVETRAGLERVLALDSQAVAARLVA